MRTAIPAELDTDHRRCIVGGEPMVFHCHHYNTFLQRSIQDAEYIDSVPFLVGAAAEVSFAQLSQLFGEEGIETPERRTEVAADLFQWAGFGVVDMTGLASRGGEAFCTPSHYAWAWSANFRGSDQPVCHFAAGWISGAHAAIFGHELGSFDVFEDICAADEGGESCGFHVSEGLASYSVFSSVGMGPLTEHQIQPIESSPVDYHGIYQAVTGLDLVGDERGLIDAFGVYLTRHYANYYNRISFEFQRQAVEMFGAEGHTVAEPLLVEAGHVCAFNTFGGIMCSAEWDALIRPSLTCHEDWVHGIVAAVNALGWGRWQVTEVSEKSAVFVIHDDYESVGRLAMYGVSDHTASYLATGAAIGIMNLIYVGDIASKPDLDEELYTHLFRSEPHYVGTSVRSRAMGDPFTEIRVTRSRPAGGTASRSNDLGPNGP
jgi:hypothetical protein